MANKPRLEYPLPLCSNCIHCAVQCYCKTMLFLVHNHNGDHSCLNMTATAGTVLFDENGEKTATGVKPVGTKSRMLSGFELVSDILTQLLVL